VNRNRDVRVGITTTVPLEPFLASGTVPVDLNNAFIASRDPASMVEESQVEGYPRNICTWIKGLYSASMSVDSVVGVVRGDCSNTESLLGTLELKGVPTHPFSYPLDRDRRSLLDEVERLCEFLGTDIDSAAAWAERTRDLRTLAWKVDSLLASGRLPGPIAHSLLVSTSDMMSDPGRWEREAIAAIEKAEAADQAADGPVLGMIGVPPIITDLVERTEKMGSRIAFMEVQRQFSMPFPDEDWLGAYLCYTYPYSIEGRLKDIAQQAKARRLDALVHYVQSFCHRQIDDMVFRSRLDLPILTIEGNNPGPMDERTAIRLEAFIDIISANMA